MMPSTACLALTKDLGSAFNASLNFMDQASGHAQYLTDFGKREPLGAKVWNASAFGIRQLRAWVIFALPHTSSRCILTDAILPSRNPFKIFDAIVSPVSIDVIDGSALKVAIDKCRCDKAMQVFALRGSSRSNGHGIIAVAEIRAEKAPTPELRGLKRAAARSQVIDGFCPAEIRHHHAPEKLRGVFPNFVTIIGRSHGESPLVRGQGRSEVAASFRPAEYSRFPPFRKAA